MSVRVAQTMIQTGSFSKDSPEFRWVPLLGTVALAATLWFVTFYLKWGIFCVKITLSAAVLGGLSLWLQPGRVKRLHFDKRALVLGMASATALYLIFWAGKAISIELFPSTENQIQAMCGIGHDVPQWFMALLSFLVIGPSEELYWRGYLQHQLMSRFGGWQGWLFGTTIYAGVHIFTFNIMFIGAAVAAGAFWGAMYWRLGRLAPVIISHSIWSAVIFGLLPLS